MAAKTSFLLNDGENANAAAAINLLADQGRISNFHLIRNEIDVNGQLNMNSCTRECSCKFSYFMLLDK